MPDIPSSSPQVPIDLTNYTPEQLAELAENIAREKDGIRHGEVDRIKDTLTTMQAQGRTLDGATYDVLAGEPVLSTPLPVDPNDLTANEWFNPNLIAALTIAILDYIAETSQNKEELGLMMADWLLNQMATAQDIADIIREMGELKADQKMAEAWAAVGSIVVNGLGLLKSRNVKSDIDSHKLRMGTDAMQQSITASKSFYEALVIEPGLANLEAVKTMVEEMLKADEQTIQRIAEALNVDQDIIRKFLEDLARWIDQQMQAHSLRAS